MAYGAMISRSGIKPLGTEEEKAERRQMIQALRETPPDYLKAMGEPATIAAFARTLAAVPAYRELVLRKNSGQSPEVGSLADFLRVAPIIGKHETFGAYSIPDLCIDGTLEGVRTIMTSSGHSGVFSYGVNTAENLARSARSIDMGLQYSFNVDERATLLINALPMGVKVNTRATVLAETSVRDDMVYALIKKFGPEFDQIVLVAEGSFAKKIVEDGAELHGIDWSRQRIHIVTGEEGIAENYRAYLERRLCIEDPGAPDSQVVASSMGVAELDLNIFHETRDSIRLRRAAHRDAELRAALFGDRTTVCPMLFVYYPHRTLVEELNQGGGRELVISMLSEEMKIPLLRYRSGDHGGTIDYQSAAAAALAAGLPAPDLKLPFVWVSGRGKELIAADGAITAEAVKEALYADHAIASAITGNFRLSLIDQRKAKLEVQLRRNKTAPADAPDRFLAALARFGGVRPDVSFIDYAPFPWAMEVDYERKFRYL